MTWRWLAGMLLGAAIMLVACSSDPAAPQYDERALASVFPADGTTGVDPSAPLVITFDHPMTSGMEKHLAVHEGGINGPVVPGQWSWSPDFRVLTFVATTRLKAQTTYTIHMGMGLMGAGAMSTSHHHGGNDAGHRAGSHMCNRAGGSGMMGSTAQDCVQATSFTTR